MIRQLIDTEETLMFSETSNVYQIGAPQSFASTRRISWGQSGLQSRCPSGAKIANDCKDQIDFRQLPGRGWSIDSIDNLQRELCIEKFICHLMQTIWILILSRSCPVGTMAL